MKYSFVFLHDAPVSFTLSRPDPQDKNLLLSIPLAFVTKEGKIIGVYVADGKITNSPSKKLGGALKIGGGEFEIVDTKGGAILCTEYLQKLAANKDSLIQQFAIVKNRTASSFRDKAKAQRRGLGKLKDGKGIVVESKGELTLAEFASDLVALGISELIYTDMGTWGEGWYRDPKDGKLINLGNEKHLIPNGLNWLVVSEQPDKD